MITLEDFYKGSERSKRISVDIDKGLSNLQPLKVFFALKGKFKFSKVTMQRTRHGFHIKAVGKEIGKIPLKKRVEMREGLADDPMRIEYDKRKIVWGMPYTVDTLFEIKKNYDGETTFVEDVNPVALPYWPKIPCLKRVVQKDKEKTQ